MSFHNYEKKVNRKTNKTRQAIDDKKKYKMQRKNAQKKNRVKNEGSSKIITYVFDEKKMIRDNFFSF